MRATLSLNEIVSKSTRALAVLGLPPWTDIENGKNIGWLEAHNLPGLKYLCQEIREFSDQDKGSTMKLVKNGTDISFVGCDQSGFLLAQSAIDFTVKKNKVNIQSCRYPLLLLAEIARRRHLTYGLKIQWGEGTTINTCFCIAGHTYCELKSDIHYDAFDIELTPIKDLEIANFTKMKEEWKSSLKNGIKFKKSDWELVCKTSNMSLVPNSEVSRTSAGPEVDDRI